MTTLPASSSFYVTGGTLIRDAPSYVTRQADTELFESLRASEFCYVLNSRQMGKSSLMVRTAQRLKAENVKVAVLDLTSIGQNLNPEQWYVGLLYRLGEVLGIEEAMEDFWHDQKHLSPLQRWQEALRKIALVQIPGRIVIFVDEIDVVRSLPFSADEFFAAIRQCYVGRATDPELQRLTFCLLGTATPADLIQDTRVSPFNVGKRVEVRDFLPQEAAPLAEGLGRNGLALLQRVLYWTGGHPYLTQRLCRSVAEAGVQTHGDVDRLCTELFLTQKAKETDDNLMFVRNRLLKSEVDLNSLLDLYRQVHSGKRVAYDETDPLCSVLRLSGAATVREGLLQVRNRIYATVFDRAWVEQHTSDAEKRRQQRAYQQGLFRAAAIAGVILLALGALAFQAIRSEHKAKSALDKAIGSERKAGVALKHEQAAQQAERAQRMAAQKSERNAIASAAVAKNKAHEAELASKAERKAATLARVAQARSKAEAQRADWESASARQSARQERFARENSERLAYIANMNLIQREWENNNVGHVRELLEETSHNSERGFEWGHWQRLSHQQLLTLQGSGARIRSMAFFPDGKRVVAVRGEYGRPGQLKIWDASTGQELPVLKLSPQPMTAFALSSDGKRIVTNRGDYGKPGAVQVWDTMTGQELLALKLSPQPLMAFALSPDGKRIVAAQGDYGKPAEVKIWDASTGQELLTLGKHRQSISSLAFSPDGRHILILYEDPSGFGEAKIWDAITGQEAFTLKGFLGNGAAFSPDSRRIVAGTGGYQLVISLGGAVNGHPPTQLTESYQDSITTAQVWEVATRKESLALTGRTTGKVFGMAFSPDGRWIAACTGSYSNADKPGQAIVWDAATGKEVQTLSGHTSQVKAVCFSPDSQRLITQSTDGSSKVWEVATGQEILTVREASSASVLSPDGRRLAAADADGVIKIWDVTTNHEHLTIRANPIGTFFGRSIAFSPDGRRIGVPNYFAPGVFDVNTGQRLLTFKGSADNIAYSSDGRQIATVRLGVYKQPGEISVWNARTGEKALAWKGHTNTIRSIVFSPDGKHLLTSSDDQTAKIWDASTGREILSLRGHTAGVSGVCYSPDGKQIVTASQDKTARVWDSVTGKKMRTLQGHSGALFSVAFSPNGKYIVTGSNDATARVWDAATGKPALTLKGHTSYIYSVAISSDSKRIVTGSADRTAKIWYARTGRELLTLRDRYGIQAVAFSPDGQRIASANANAEIKIWRSTLEKQSSVNMPGRSPALTKAGQ